MPRSCEILHRYVAINRRDAIQPAFNALLGIADQVLAVDRAMAEHVMRIFARNYFGSMRLSPFILEKCRLLNVATSLPRSRAVAPTIRS